MAVAFALQRSAAGHYKIIDLRVDCSMPQAAKACDRIAFINDQGTIVANGCVGKSIVGAWMIQGDKYRCVDGIRYGSRTFATAINANGVVCGSVTDGRDRSHVATWRNGKLHDFGTLGLKDAKATGINDQGEIVGFGHAKNRDMAFYFDRMGKRKSVPKDLIAAKPLAINNRSQIAGCKFAERDTVVGSPYTNYAFEFSQGTWRYLSPGRSDVTDINNAGTIVGGTEGLEDYMGAIWQDGKETSLELFSYPSAINDHGDIVGAAGEDWAVSDKYTRACIWHNDQKTYLDTLVQALGDWKLVDACDINNKGEIVGIGLWHGYPRVFLLRPTP